jgi:hypothetical protein
MEKYEHKKICYMLLNTLYVILKPTSTFGQQSSMTERDITNVAFTTTYLTAN